MIVSITCRNGTEENTRRSEINRELLSLSNFDSEIARAQVVFSKQTHHKNSSDLVTCHLSLSLPNKQKVEIYEHQWAEMNAFHRAKERAIKSIKRDHSSKFVSLKHAPAALRNESLL